MEINSIKAFVAVANAKSFSDAAKALHLTQPAVSKRVALLEQEIEEQLFDRIGRKIMLTEAGELLLPQCQQILDTLDNALLSLDNLAGKVHGKLSIGTSHHIGLHRLPSYLRQFSQEYPHVDLDIQFMASEEICENIEQGELELGIITLPKELPGNLYSRVLWKDPLKFVIGKTHPLASMKKINLKTLAEYEALLPEQNTYTREIVELVFSNKKLPLLTKMETNYLETLKMMVSVGLGWSVLPTSMLDEDVKPINVEKISLSRNLGYVQNKKRTLSNAALAMLRLLNEKQSRF